MGANLKARSGHRRHRADGDQHRDGDRRPGRPAASAAGSPTATGAGRRCRFNLLLYSLGGLISAVALNYEMLLASRLIVGIGLGGEFTIGIAMLSEMVATRHRGTLVAALNIGSGGVGQLPLLRPVLPAARPAGAGLGGDDLVWRWTFVFLALPALLVVLYRRRLPESPRFLLSKGRIDEANRSLAILISDSLTPADRPAPTVPLTEADVPPRQLAVDPGRGFRPGGAAAHRSRSAPPPGWPSAPRSRSTS